MTARPHDDVVADFTTRFGEAPHFIARAPGRVNLIGEHTDYNDGFVLPVAIDRAMWIAFTQRPGRRVVLHSLDVGDTIDFISTEPQELEDGGWHQYVAGVSWAFGESQWWPLGGFDGVMSGDVPQGAGLSSSAALELAVARTFAETSGITWDPPRMARVAQSAENQWVGVQSGIMDQMVSAAAREGHALLLDCRSLATRHVPVPAHAAIVVLDTATRRELVTSAYNERRAQCERAAEIFGVPALRDVDEATFAARADELDDVTRRRARHVVTENARTLRAADALSHGDLAEVGRLMDASHTSLRDDFEVSRPELDAIVAIARGEAGCYGARMTGAGFGGCAVALVERSAADAFAATVARQYEATTGLRPSIYVTMPSAGASLTRHTPG